MGVRVELFRQLRLGGLAAAVVLVASVAQAEGGAPKTVTSLGQAVVYGGDTALARDKAIEDAQRKAVEKAVGTMVASETITENFQLISDKIFSRSKGYVRGYEVLSETEEDGVYRVKIEAQVAQGNLKNDLDGIKSILRGKNMPRVLVMIAEQNVGQASAEFWWGNKNFSTNLDSVENAFIDQWTAQGLDFVDRQALQGKLSTGPALSSANPAEGAVKEFAGKTGAEVVVIGKAVATDAGTIMGTKMHSIRANISVRALHLDTGRIMATSTQSKAVGHIDPVTGGTRALTKVAEAAADELLQKILDQWQSEVAGPTTVQLTVSNFKRSRQVRQLMGILRNRVRGIQTVRQRRYGGQTAHLEVDLEGSSQDLAMELEEKKFPGFRVVIEAITANTVTAALEH